MEKLSTPYLLRREVVRRQVGTFTKHSIRNLTGTAHHLPSDTESSWHLISIDLGTSTISSGYLLLHPGRSINATDYEKIRLSQNSTDHGISQAIAAFHDGKWLIGHDLEQQQNDIPEHKIISCWKLLLYESHKNTKQAQRVHQQLLEADQTLPDLLRATLAYVWKQTWIHINTEVLHGDRSYDDSPILAYISVPQLATPRATKLLKAASREAGIPRVRFVYEALCAGACIVEELVRKSTWFSRMSRLVSTS